MPCGSEKSQGGGTGEREALSEEQGTKAQLCRLRTNQFKREPTPDWARPQTERGCMSKRHVVTGMRKRNAQFRNYGIK